MMSYLFDTMDANYQEIVIDGMRNAKLSFKPLWIITLYLGYNEDCIDWQAINTWLIENSIVGFVYPALKVCVLASDDSMALYRLRWANEYL